MMDENNNKEKFYSVVEECYDHIICHLITNNIDKACRCVIEELIGDADRNGGTPFCSFNITDQLECDSGIMIEVGGSKNNQTTKYYILISEEVDIK